MDKNKDFWSSPNKVMVLFFMYIGLAGLFIYLATTVDIQPIEVLMVIVSYVLIGLAFAILNKGSSAKMEERVRRIENKLDKILEHMGLN